MLRLESAPRSLVVGVGGQHSVFSAAASADCRRFQNLWMLVPLSPPELAPACLRAENVARCLKKNTTLSTAALVTNIQRPVPCNRTSARSHFFAAQDRPINASSVDLADRANQRLEQGWNFLTVASEASKF